MESVDGCLIRSRRKPFSVKISVFIKRRDYSVCGCVDGCGRNEREGSG